MSEFESPQPETPTPPHKTEDEVLAALRRFFPGIEVVKEDDEIVLRDSTEED